MAKAIPLEGFRISVTKKLQDGLKTAGKLLYDKMRENAGLVDHTLEDLARMGYPYAKRHPQLPHSPSYLIHRQTQLLYQNIEMHQINQYAIDVGVDINRVPYLKSVIYGTKFMVPRDFITGSYHEVRKDLEDVFSKAVHDGNAEVQ